MPPPPDPDRNELPPGPRPPREPAIDDRPPNPRAVPPNIDRETPDVEDIPPDTGERLNDVREGLIVAIGRDLNASGEPPPIRPGMNPSVMPA